MLRSRLSSVCRQIHIKLGSAVMYYRLCTDKRMGLIVREKKMKESIEKVMGMEVEEMRR
jgi:hypothetical protein